MRGPAARRGGCCSSTVRAALHGTAGRELGRGHPLALALLADAAQGGAVPDSLADVPDLISVLLESLLRDAPSEAHMAGLATAARAWLTTEDLLRKTVGTDAAEVWGWLQRRPFVVCRRGGLTPHDVTRDVLEAEFERRSPDRYRGAAPDPGSPSGGIRQREPRQTG